MSSIRQDTWAAQTVWRCQGYAVLPPARRIPSKNNVILKIFPAQPYQGVFCASVGFYDVTAIFPPQSVELHKVWCFYLLIQPTIFFRAEKCCGIYPLHFCPKNRILQSVKGNPLWKYRFSSIFSIWDNTASKRKRCCPFCMAGASTQSGPLQHKGLLRQGPMIWENVYSAVFLPRF